jgi:hypothetical protein
MDIQQLELSCIVSNSGKIELIHLFSCPCVEKNLNNSLKLHTNLGTPNHSDDYWGLFLHGYFKTRTVTIAPNPGTNNYQCV